MQTKLEVPQGQFQIKRYPKNKYEHGSLRAWDAADELLLTHLAEIISPTKKDRVLIFNDSFGALSVALNDLKPQAVSDSFLSQQGTRSNLLENSLEENQVSLLSSLDPPEGLFDIVLIKPPKTLALLEDFLIRIKPHITPDTQIIAAAMVKNLPASVWKMIEQYIGPTTPSKAKKKARLIFSTPDEARLAQTTPSPYPVYYQLEETEYSICNHANVFSRESLDIGTRFLLAHLPQIAEAKHIYDLGCGNGIVGLMLAEKNPQATLHFVDESFMAIASAKETFTKAMGEEHSVSFQIRDVLNGVNKNSADLIVCNPPFHQQHSTGDQTAMRMFVQSKEVLKAGGELWVIGNRHLDYHLKLKKVFGHADVVASNSKFVILKVVA